MENCLIASASMESLPKRMPLRPSNKSWVRCTTFTSETLSIAVRHFLLPSLGIRVDANKWNIDLKPENLLYLTPEPNSPLVLADFGIAKMLESPSDVLTSMAGSFGYAAPEVMLKQGHGKAVDMWSMGVITYTLLCGYSPFRSENVPDLIEECRQGRIIFHERYWKDVSQDAKDFILTLLQPDPSQRATAEEALQHRWLKGDTATDHNLLPEIKAYIARARLRRGIEIIKLSNRIKALKAQAEEEEDIPDGEDMEDANHAAIEANQTTPFPSVSVPDTGEKKEGGDSPAQGTKKRSLSRAARGAIFREVVLAKVREMKEQEQVERVEREALARAEASQSS